MVCHRQVRSWTGGEGEGEEGGGVGVGGGGGGEGGEEEEEGVIRLSPSVHVGEREMAP